MPYTFRGFTLPDHLKKSIDAYVSDGLPTGDFLRACIENNLTNAVGRADEESMKAIPAIVGYLYNECDGRCWGSKERYAAWLDRKYRERIDGAVKCEEMGGAE